MLALGIAHLPFFTCAGSGGDLLGGERPAAQLAAIQAQIAARAAAKAAKNFAEADRIRNDLLAQGIVLKDSASGTTWEAAQ